MAAFSGVLERARRAFYDLAGPWYRCRLFERLGSRRYSRPALFGMDLAIAQLLPGPGHTFLEAGAHDGYTQSNTYYLERHLGWRGVLVEAVPELAARCARRRPDARVFGCAVVGPGSDGATIDVQFGDLMSTVAADGTHAARGLATTSRRGYTARVPARTLCSIVEEAGIGPVDVMVLDLEGAELDALAGLDLERQGPAYLVVETLERDTQEPALTAALAGFYESAGCLSDYDLLYRRRA